MSTRRVNCEIFLITLTTYEVHRYLPFGLALPMQTADSPLVIGHLILINRPFYSCVLSYLAMNVSEAGGDLAPASLPFRDQVTKPTTVKWSVNNTL